MRELRLHFLLAFLLLMILFSGCRKEEFIPTFEDLLVYLTVSVQTDGDVIFTYVEENFSDHRIDYSRNSSCPEKAIEVYQNDTLVDRVDPMAVCSDDVPRGFLLEGTTFEQSVNWLEEPSHSPLPPGTYQARSITRIGLIHNPGSSDESTEWQDLELEVEFTIQ